ncbi:MAG: SpoIIIAH-like family protein [Clostridiales bacterium]|jgi:stage III sporulation protein AH|nr:SpoIIIAH-like family protein [Clostridiales bacterium]
MFVLKRNQIIITALIVMIAVAGYLNFVDGRSPQTTGLTLNEAGEIDALAPASVNSDMGGYEIGTALTLGEDDDPSISDSLNGIVSNDLASSGLTSDDLTSSGLTSDGLTSDSASSNQEYTDAAGSENAAEPGTSGGQSEPGESVFVTAYTNASRQDSYFVQAKLTREQTRAKEKDILTEMLNNTNIAQEQKAEAVDSMMEIQKRIEKETAAEAMIESKGFSEVYVRIDDNSVDVVVNKEALTDAEIAQIEDIVKRKTGMREDQIHISPMRK